MINILNLPIVIFDTYAESQVEGALSTKSKFVIILEDESANGKQQLYFYMAGELHRLSGGSAVGTDYAELVGGNNFQGTQSIDNLAGKLIQLSNGGVKPMSIYGNTFGGIYFCVNCEIEYDELDLTPRYRQVQSGTCSYYVFKEDGSFDICATENNAAANTIVYPVLKHALPNGKKYDVRRGEREISTEDEYFQDEDLTNLIILNGEDSAANLYFNVANTLYQGATVEIMCINDDHDCTLTSQYGYSTAEHILLKDGSLIDVLNFYKGESRRFLFNGTNLREL